MVLLFAGWMYSVCHVVILVQDWFLDMNLMRLLQAAETLKPVTPTGFSSYSSQYLSLLVEELHQNFSVKNVPNIFRNSSVVL
jgi:hypothetical protein